MKRISIFIALTFMVVYAQSQPSRPKIGLTLSGGGAKGLAHIGIIKAIDSAGLKIDYITGTSIGSIVGGLYAIGYSADTLEKMANRIDWELLLSNQSSLRSLFMEEKNEYDKYMVELPWVNHSFRLPTGVLEAQELWLKLAELFYPVYNKKNFAEFNIPFRCIGTDVGSGEAVILQKGEIVSAVRASMAIPTVFTAVDYEGRRLIDGGITRNFPVQDVKEMGAEIVIGSNVATGLLSSDKVRNVIQVLLQIAFFHESADNKKEVPLCDIYIPIDVQKYTMGSFNQAHEILHAGIAEGRKLYPQFKRLADSLDAIYGKSEFKRDRLPPIRPVKISAYEVKGADVTTEHFFLNTMDFDLNREYSITRLNAMVRKAFGTRHYNRITYSLIPQPDGSAKIIFEVEENPLTFAKLGIHYNRFTGVGLIANITSRNFFVKNSRSLATVNIGESFRIRGEHLQYLGRKKEFSFVLNSQFDRLDITTYNQFKEEGLYRQNYFVFDDKIQFSFSRQFIIGLGSRFEWTKYSPSITKGLSFKGENSFKTAYLFFNYNTLDRNNFPKRGAKFDAETGRVFRQNPHVKFFRDGGPVSDPDTIPISDQPYFRFWVNAEKYTLLSRKSVFFANLQTGVNFDSRRNIMNEFVIGGITRLFHNQVTFAGLSEGALYTAGVFALQAGLRYEAFNNIYLTGRANISFTDFITQSSFFQNPGFLSGYALTFAYNFALGPLEISVMYGDQPKKLSSYINLGIAL